MRVGQAILSLGFTLLITSFLWTILIRGERNELITENRKAQKLPLHDTNFRALAPQYENYVNDQMPLRNRLVKFKSLISLNWFSSSPFPKKVILGKDNWLFYNEENNIETYRGDQLYTTEELQQLGKILEEKRNWLGQFNIDFYLMINPSKPEIYEEMLPSYLQRNPENRGKCGQVVDYLNANTGVTLVHAKENLLNAKKNRQVYYSYDSHWNTFGARVAYAELIDAIRIKHPIIPPPMRVSDIEYHEELSDNFDLYKMLNLPGYTSTMRSTPTKMKYASAVKIDKKDYAGVSISPSEFYEQQSSELPKMLMFRDSYGDDLIPYLNCHFSRTTYIRSPLFFPNVIKAENPDIVILEVTERFISDLFIANHPTISNQS
ncbi:MAG: hypothetical protein CL840_07655 [Crocinitomicaceae bacterium]|nr:hypothetical protein [Crocinitomicaceae bacterium]|tara:strand:+ start:1535 stop:2665 length:1131 start_codon:yes stop_codon:yes gene_type:complete